MRSDAQLRTSHAQLPPHPVPLQLPFLYNLCLMVLLLMYGVASRADTAGYYSASVPVNSQSIAERERAAAQGLQQVLVRMSGIADISTYPRTLDVLTKASRHIQQFHYELVRGADGRRVEHLVMRFSPSVVENLIKEAGLPYWPPTRPTTLVWLVEDDVTEGKRLINDTSGPVMQGLSAGAQQRGVPLLLPLLDLDDQLAITAEQVWNLDEDAILSASERYAADAVLVGRYTRTFSGQWWTTWQYFHQGTGRLYEYRGEDAFLQGQQGLAPLADYLAGRYALESNPEAADQLYVQLSPVSDFGAYRKALDYLRSLAVVTSYDLLAVTDDVLFLSLRLNGSQNQLLSALSLDNKMRSRTPPATQAPWMTDNTGSAEKPLQLQWIGR